MKHVVLAVGLMAASMTGATAPGMRTGLGAPWSQQEPDWKLAAEIQQSLLPKSIPAVAGYDVGVFWKQTKEIGGDLYDVIPLSGGRTVVMLLDVMGKGLPAALVLPMAAAYLRAEARNPDARSPGDILKRANRNIVADIKKGMFVQAFVGILDPGANELSYAAAGAEKILFRPGDGGKVQILESKGIALGLDKGAVFDRTLSEFKQKFEPGDALLHFSGGVVGSLSSRDRDAEFGLQRVRDLFEANKKLSAGDLARNVGETVTKFADEMLLDLTILSIRRDP